MEKAKLNIPDKETAEIIGVSRQMLNAYMTDGKTVLSRKHKAFLPLCKLYNLDPEEIGKMIDRQRAEERKAKS